MSAPRPVRLSGWGGVPVHDCRLARPRSEAALAALAALPGGPPLIARGAGRAYGDSALGPGLTVSTARFAACWASTARPDC